MNIPKPIREYVNRLTNKYPEITSIWLFGSRANNTFRDNSDWDLFVFADTSVLEQLKEDKVFDVENIDLLVVYSNEEEYYEGPYPESKNAVIKKGHLKDFEWQQTSEDEAEYKSKKYLSEEEWFKNDNFKEEILKAIKIWP